MDSTTDDEREASVCTSAHPLLPTPAVTSAAAEECEAFLAHVDPNDTSSCSSSSLPALRSTESTTAAPAADLRTPLPVTVEAPPSSDFYAFLTRQRNSLLGLFNGATNSTSRGAEGGKPTTSRCASSSLFFSSPNPSCRAGQEARSAPTTNAAAAAARGEQRSLDDFLSYFALPGLYSEADTVLERHAARLGLETALESSGASFNSDSVSASANDRAPPNTAATAATSTKTTASPAKPDHVHHLRPTPFFVPTLCEVCRRAVLDTKVWPPPSAASTKPSHDGTPSPAAAAAPSFFSRFLLSPTSASSLQPPSPSSSPGEERTETTAAVSTTTTTTSNTAAAAASPVQQPFLGFGSEGYHCEMCDLALHRQCLRKLRETQQCVVLAPTAHHIPEDTPTTKPGEKDAAASSSSFSWDGVKSLLGSYLDPSGGANSRKDANVKVVLSGVFALLDTVAQRYPDLSPLTFVKRRQAIQELSLAHQTLYAACTTSLVDTKLLQAITWDAIEQRDTERTACRRGGLSGGAGGEANDDEEEGGTRSASLVGVSLLTREMHPVKMDTSLFSHLTASLSGTASSSATDVKNYLPSFAQPAPAEVTGPGASFPVQLLLWRAVRYAMAVYGEVYRRGSLSSTVSAALLFTVNRGSVDVAKEANDKAVTSLLELPPSSLRLSRWAAQTTEPSYVLLVDHAVGHIVVSFRGTLNTFDIMTDLAAVGVPFCTGYAHQGAAHVVNSIFDHRSSQYADRKQPRPDSNAAASGGVEVKVKTDGSGNVKVVLEPYAMQALETPDGLLDGLEELAADYPTYSILITGHSLGGAIAVLFATRLHHDGVFADAVLRRVHVIAFAPMPSLSLPAASCFDAVSCERADGGFGHDTVGAAADTRVDKKKARASSSLHEPPPPLPPPQRHQQQHQPPPPNASSSTAIAPTAACVAKGEIPESEVRQAVFPVWNVVNGFDCVPRLQVNTIDRLLRQVVGPQVAASTSTAAGARRRGNREGREMSVPGEEMAEMPPAVDAPAASAAAAVVSPAVAGQDSEVDAASAAEVKAAETDARGVALESSSGECTNTTASRTTATTAHSTEEAEEVVVRTPASTLQATTEKTKEAPASAMTTSVAAAGVTSPPTAASTTAAGKAPRTDGDLSHELHHPGRVLLLTSPWETTQNRLVDVPRGHPVMHELFLMKFMLLQHALDAYGGALTEIRSQ